MKNNKIEYIIVFVMFFFITFINTNAASYNDIKNRTNCPNFELVEINTSKNISHIGCYNDFESAQSAMNSSGNEYLVVLERTNGETVVADAKIALVYLDIGDKTTDYYSNSNLTGYITYMNHSGNYGATDGVYMGVNRSNKAIRVKTNGLIGWIKNGTYKIIPLNLVGTTGYYQVTSDSLLHYYGKNITTNYSSYGRALDKKPSMLNQGKYYSYDGNYFYSDLRNLIIDTVNGNYNNSVNKNNPYYNYYMYLPHRARSNYTADDIDAYLKNTRNLIGSIYGKTLVSRYSNMWATGIFFKSSETLYGGNAILMMSLATNESALGQSRISIDKNNLFGHAAYDSSAYDSATGYLNPYQSILGHAKSYINCGYANPNDYRYYGSNMGNKSSGMNIMYASDPYWGEKAANYYYLFDKDNGFLDYNYYKLGITTHSSVNVRSEPNTTSAIPFNLKYENVPLIILGEVEGPNINGTTKWYKIASDANLTSDRKSVQACSYTNYYNYDGYVYISAAFVKIINDTSVKSINTSNDRNYIYEEYSNGASYNPKVVKAKNNTTVYDTATLSVPYGKTMSKDNMAPVFMRAMLDGQVVAYLIEVDYTKNQKGWVKASDVEFVDKDLLKVNINESGEYINAFKTPGGSSVGNIYDATFLTILDKKDYNNETWLQVYYGVDNTIAWVNTNLSSSIGSLNYTLNNLGNKEPVINVDNLTILENQEFNPLDYVSAMDSEDGDITSKIKVISNNVNIKVIGNYEVTYQVTDSNNQTVSKTITVSVIGFNEGNPLFMYESLKQINNTKFEVKGFLGVKKMDNKNLVHFIEFVNEDDFEDIYVFPLDKYTNYPYEMSSLDDDKKYDYSGGWFKGEIDLSKENIPEGNYYIIVGVYNYDTGYYTGDYFTNIAYLDMPRRIETNERGIAFDIDYSSKGSPMLVTIRDKGLISYTQPTSFDPTYNFFNELSINNNTLNILGTSHSINISYSKNDNVKRELIFENTDTLEKISYDVGYIDDGPYKIELPVSDNKDKTRAWFRKDIDLSNLPKGNYSIYVKTTSNDKTYYGELIDVAYTDFSNINTSKYQFQRIDDKRMRLELVVK